MNPYQRPKPYPKYNAYFLTVAREEKAVDPTSQEIRIWDIYTMLKQGVKPWEFERSYIKANQKTFYRQDIADIKALSSLGL